MREKINKHIPEIVKLLTNRGDLPLLSSVGQRLLTLCIIADLAGFVYCQNIQKIIKKFINRCAFCQYTRAGFSAIMVLKRKRKGK